MTWPLPKRRGPHVPERCRREYRQVSLMTWPLPLFPKVLRRSVFPAPGPARELTGNLLEDRGFSMI